MAAYQQEEKEEKVPKTTNRIDRVIALLDIDAFECQIWQRMFPERQAWNLPCVVADKTGRITSATYEAKAIGISRDVRIRHAKDKAREAGAKLNIFWKPNDREKPDNKETRYASWEVLDALKEYCQLYTYDVTLEFASSDEFYLDLTEEVGLQVQMLSKPEDKAGLVLQSRTFLEGESSKYHGEELKSRITNLYDNIPPDLDGQKKEQLSSEKSLVYGAVLMQDIQNFLFRKTRFSSSVGIGPNKLMAKLAVSLNRPDGITVLSEEGLVRVGPKIPLEKIPGLGGKSGSQIKEIFEVETIGDLRKVELDDLEDVFEGEKALDVYLKCRGISDEPVKEKLFYDEVNCGKTFIGQINSDETLYYHLHCLVEEIIERLGEERARNQRVSSNIRAQVTYQEGKKAATSTSSTSTGNTGSLWSYNIEGGQQKTVKDLCDSIFWKISDEIDITTVAVSKIRLSAKGFQKIQSEPSSSSPEPPT